MVKSIPEMLLDSAATFEERSKVYGDNYKRFGAVMALLFPTGLSCKSIDDYNRLGVFVQVVSKMTRYAENFHKGGHEDSLIDISVYATMLRELDAGMQEKAQSVKAEEVRTEEFGDVAASTIKRSLRRSGCSSNALMDAAVKNQQEFHQTSQFIAKAKEEKAGKDYSW